MLTRRLTGLVEAGLLERRQYSERPPRFEYVLTERGWDFRPVLATLLAWGNKHFAPDPVLVDRVSGRPLSDPVFTTAPGPAAEGELPGRMGQPNSDDA